MHPYIAEPKNEKIFFIYFNIFNISNKFHTLIAIYKRQILLLMFQKINSISK